jgi:hypothetical protein
MPAPTVVEDDPVLTSTAMSESLHGPDADGVGVGLAEALAASVGAAWSEAEASGLALASGSPDIEIPKLGDGLGASADGVPPPDPKAARSSIHPSRTTTSRTMSATARRRQ